MNIISGMHYAPSGKPSPVVNIGEFVFAAISLEHGHIYGMCNGLIEAGATLKWVYDADKEKVTSFIKKYPNVKIAHSEKEILEDSEVKLIAGAAVPNLRCELGLRVMNSGKDYFTDKAPFTTLEQLAMAKNAVLETGMKYMVYFSERIHVEAAIYAGTLINQGAIGRVLQVIGMGPHRLSAPIRPEWFFEKKKYGGIHCDIGIHQIEQFLSYSGATNATVTKSQVANYNHHEYPELEDFGDAMLLGENGATQYFRVDWFTPDGLSTWGDGRTFILGTDGYIELRKYVNVGMNDKTKDHVFLVNKDGEQHFNVDGKIDFPFFGQLILDCINRTENAMTQEHAFKAAELSLIAQNMALRI